MRISQEIEIALRKAVPKELGQDIPLLVQLLTEATIGELPQSFDTRPIIHRQSTSQLLRALAGQKLTTEQVVVSFGQENQIGDISIRDIAGGNIINVTINIYQGTTSYKALTPITNIPQELKGRQKVPPLALTILRMTTKYLNNLDRQGIIVITAISVIIFVAFSAAYILLNRDSSNQYRVNIANGLNLRVEPGVNSQIIDVIPNGAIIQRISGPITQDNIPWLRVRYTLYSRQAEGWVSMYYVVLLK